MTRDQILLDLYSRLTSRKFLGFCGVMFFAIWNWWAGRMDDLQFQASITAAFTVYGVIEGATDFAAAWRPTPKAPEAVVTTNVDASPVAPAPRRVRPSRAKK